MQKSILVLYFIFYFTCGYTQTKIPTLSNHSISLEGGVYHRGMIGLGYQYVIHPKDKQIFYTIHANIGSKYPWVYPNKDIYVTTAIARNIPIKNYNLLYGISFKYIQTPYWSDLAITQSYKDLNDFLYGIFFGIQIPVDQNISLQCRLNYSRSFNPLTDPAPWYNLEQNYYSAFGAGLGVF